MEYNNNFIDLQKIRNNITIYIYSSPYVENIANYISVIFSKYKINNYKIVSLISDEHFNIINDNNNCFLFLLVFQSFLNSQNKDKLLKLKKNKYILYQLEQINTEEKYNNNMKLEYNNFLKNALYILDYNINNFNNIPSSLNKMFVSVPIIKDNLELPKKDIDLLFYGNINENRKDILDKISKKFEIKIIEKAFGKELTDIIKRSKIIINIHYFDDALLEICRFHEAIPYNCRIISDLVSKDQQDIVNNYKQFCTFIDFKNEELLINTIESELTNYNNLNFERFNYDSLNNNFINFVKKIKYYNLFNKDLLNIKNSTYNYKLSLLDDDFNIKNIVQNFSLENKNNKNNDKINKKSSLNINFKNSKQTDIYLKMLKKIDKKNILNNELEYFDKENDETDINNNLNKKFIDNIAHLHCFDLSKFDEIYGDYLPKIESYFKIIITYCIISTEKEGYNKYNKNYILLNIENRGMDIGGKFCFVHYLEKNNIEFKYVLFLHSKSNNIQRKKFFSFINSKNIEKTLLKMGDEYDGIFPNLEINGDWKTGEWYINKGYTEDLLEYLDCEIDEKKFIAGNCMILSNRIIKKIFSDNLFIYELLNKKDSFDCSWFSWYYKTTSLSFVDNYNIFQNKNYYGNDLSHNYKKIFGERLYIDISKLKNLDGFKLPDAMIEHAFERIYLNVINSFKDGKYFIIK